MATTRFVKVTNEKIIVPKVTENVTEFGLKFLQV